MNIFKTLKDTLSYLVDTTSTSIDQVSNIIKGDNTEAVFLAAEFAKRHPRSSNFILSYYQSVSDVFEFVSEAFQIQYENQIKIMNISNRKEAEQYWVGGSDAKVAGSIDPMVIPEQETKPKDGVVETIYDWVKTSRDDSHMLIVVDDDISTCIKITHNPGVGNFRLSSVFTIRDRGGLGCKFPEYEHTDEYGRMLNSHIRNINITDIEDIEFLSEYDITDTKNDTIRITKKR